MKYFLIFFLVCFVPVFLTAQVRLSESETVSYDSMVEFLKRIDSADHIRINECGTSFQGRTIFLVRLKHEKQEPAFKLFFFGQQHGNEVAGKDALIHLINELYLNPEKLPADVEIRIIPMVNPDGAEANTRRNANDADLNRDHVLLQQPETIALHREYRKYMPHISVDCHEFSRDSESYVKKGWLEWPLIMMDTANNPLYDRNLYETGLEWVKSADKEMSDAGYNYCRYYVGGLPPLQELRFSTPERDDARNGLGAYHGLSFIIETGVKRKAENPNADLNQRVAAYKKLLWQFIRNTELREQSIKVVEAAQKRKAPDYIPVNYFWANYQNTYSDVRVLDLETKKTQIIKTPNFMTDLVVKKNVPAPKAYIIPAEYTDAFTGLLSKHDLKFITLEKSMNFKIQPAQLLRIEAEYDDVYNRYAGRQIVRLRDIKEREFPKGSLLIKYKGINGIRAASLLEPAKLYGLYQYDEFRSLVDTDSIVPVYREME